MDDWKESNHYTRILFNGVKTVIEDNEVETLEDNRKRDKKRRDGIKPYLKQACFFRDSRTGRVMDISLLRRPIKDPIAYEYEFCSGEIG